IRDQLEGLLERVEIELKSNPGDLDTINKILSAIGKYANGTYSTVKHRQTVYIHPSGLAQVLPRWVVYHELVLTSKEYMRQFSELKPEWIVEIAALRKHVAWNFYCEAAQNTHMKYVL
ncbi:pre-mRNA-splicing factor ATP-dependent RNA helicase DEAH1-like protein, partial [Tanacetum coccineum]